MMFFYSGFDVYCRFLLNCCYEYGVGKIFVLIMMKKEYENVCIICDN